MQEAKDFILKMMQRDPNLRMSASKALSAPWLANHHALQEARARAVAGGATEEEDTARAPLSTSMRHLADGLSAFGENQKLKKLALMFVARQASTRQIDELRKAFNVLDVDRTGILTCAELQTALEQVGYEASEIQTIFQGADIRSTGQIEYTEFIAATLAAQGGVREEHLRDAFDRLDSDNSGLITKKNLRELLGTEYDSKEVDNLIAESDLTGNGAVSYREFIALFYKGRSILETNDEGYQVLVNRPSQKSIDASSSPGDILLDEEPKAEMPAALPAEPAPA